MADFFNVLAWNSHNGNGRPQEAAQTAMRLMHEYECRVAVLTEARKLIPFLRAWAQRTGGRVIAEDASSWRLGSELGDTVIVLAPGVKSSGWWTMVQTLRWVVRSTGVWHTPRRHQRVRLVDEPIDMISAEHWPPGGPASVNGKAWAECRESARGFLSARPGSSRAVIGDLNGSRDELSELIASTDADYSAHGVDAALVVGGTVRPPLPIGKHGSDHEAVVFEIARRPKSRKKAA